MIVHTYYLYVYAHIKIIHCIINTHVYKFDYVYRCVQNIPLISNTLIIVIFLFMIFDAV